MSINCNLKFKELNSQETLKIKKLWENSFVPIGTNKEKIHMNCMLWHVFSYNIVNCEKGIDVINSFKNVLKDSLYVFYQNKDTAYIIDTISNSFTFDDINRFANDFETADIYITDKEFKWTFVKTHEDGWLGPYFCKKL